MTAASSSSPVLSAAHRRRLNDVERDAADYGSPCDDVDSDGGHRGHGAGVAGVKVLFSVRRNNKRAPVVDQAWMRNMVACLLCLAVVVGLLSSHRGGSAGGRFVQRVDVGDGKVLGRREENLTALTRRPPDQPGNLRSFMAGVQDLQVVVAVLYFSSRSKLDTRHFRNSRRGHSVPLSMD